MYVLVRFLQLSARIHMGSSHHTLCGDAPSNVLDDLGNHYLSCSNIFRGLAIAYLASPIGACHTIHSTFLNSSHGVVRWIHPLATGLPLWFPNFFNILTLPLVVFLLAEQVIPLEKSPQSIVKPAERPHSSKVSTRLYMASLPADAFIVLGLP